MLVMGKPYEVNVRHFDKSNTRIVCTDCEFSTEDDTHDIKVSSPSEIHVMEMNHCVIRVKSREEVSIYRPFTQEEYLRNKRFIDDWYFKNAKCDGNCPGPGTCDDCDAMLDRDLRHDSAMQESYAEWLRTSGPPQSSNWTIQNPSI